jgi:hypothetical protein
MQWRMQDGGQAGAEIMEMLISQRFNDDLRFLLL